MNRTVCPKGMVDTCCENYDNCTLARKYPPYTAHEWWLQERDNQLDLAKFYYEWIGDCHSMWMALFAWATPDLWNDPE